MFLASKGSLQHLNIVLVFLYGQNTVVLLAQIYNNIIIEYIRRRQNEQLHLFPHINNGICNRGGYPSNSYVSLTKESKIFF